MGLICRDGYEGTTPRRYKTLHGECHLMGDSVVQAIRSLCSASINKNLIGLVMERPPVSPPSGSQPPQNGKFVKGRPLALQNNILVSLLFD